MDISVFLFFCCLYSVPEYINNHEWGSVTHKVNEYIIWNYSTLLDYHIKSSYITEKSHVRTFLTKNHKYLNKNISKCRTKSNNKL